MGGGPGRGLGRTYPASGPLGPPSLAPARLGMGVVWKVLDWGHLRWGRVVIRTDLGTVGLFPLPSSPRGPQPCQHAGGRRQEREEATGFLLLRGDGGGYCSGVSLPQHKHTIPQVCVPGRGYMGVLESRSCMERKDLERTQRNKRTHSGQKPFDSILCNSLISQTGKLRPAGLEGSLRSW